MGEISKIIGATIAIDVDENLSLANLEKAIQKFEKKLKGTNLNLDTLKVDKIDDSGFVLSVKDLQNTTYKLMNTFKEFNKNGTLKVSASTESIDKTKSKLISLNNTIANLSKKLQEAKDVSPNTNLSKYEKINNSLKKTKTLLEKVKNGQESFNSVNLDKVNSNINTIRQETTELRKEGVQAQKTAKYEQQLTKSLGATTGSKVNIGIDGTTANSINKVTKSLGLQNTAFRSAQTYIDNAGQAWTKYVYETNQADGTVKKLNVAVNQNTGEVRQNASVLNNTNTQTAKWTDRLKFKFKELTSYLSASAVIYGFFNILKSGASIVETIDTSMMNLKKVTDETNTTYNKFLKTASQTGSVLGKSTSDVIDATTEFSKLGYNLNEASELAKKALVLTNVGDGINLSDASDTIVSTMKGFNMDKTATDVEKNSQRIIDAINLVADKYAVGVTDISDSLKIMSAVMNQTGTSFEQTIGMFTAGNEIIQNESKTSNGLLTIAQRVRGMDTSGSKLSKLVPKLQGYFKQMGISLLDSNGQLKSAYDILDELAPVYSKLTPNVKQFIGEAIAGKRQISVLNATLQNWKKAQEATTTALNSTGSATRENEKYLNSITGRIKQLKQALSGTAEELLKSGFLKFWVVLATDVVKAVNTIGAGKVAFLALYATLAKFSDAPIINLLFKTSGAIKNLVLQMVAFTAKKVAESTAENANTASTLTNIVAKKTLTAVTEKLSTATKEEMEAEAGLDTQAEINDMLGLATAEEGASLGAKGLSVATGLLDSAMGLLPIVAVTAGIYGLYQLFDSLNVTVKEQEQITDTLSTKYEELTSKIKDVNSKLETTQDRIDKLNAKPHLTFVEKSELDKLKQSNDLLKEQLIFLKQKKAITEGKLSDSVEAEYKKKYNTSDVIDNNPNKKVDYSSNKVNMLTADNYITGEKALENEIIEYKKLYNEKQKGEKYDKKRFNELSTDLTNAGQDYAKYIKKGKDSGNELKNTWKSIAKSIAKALDPQAYDTEKLTNAFNKAFNNDTFSKAKKKLIDLAKAGGDLTNTKEFEALYKKLTPTLKKLGATSQDVVDQIYSLADAEEKAKSSNPKKTILSVSDALKKMNASGKLLTDTQKEFKKYHKISTDTLNDIASKYPKLSKAVAEYNAGLINDKQLIAKLKDEYDKDYDNYRDAVLKKLSVSTDFWKKVINTDYVKKLSDQYNVDFKNFKNLQEAEYSLKLAYQKKMLVAEQLEMQAEQDIMADTIESYQDGLIATSKYFKANKEAKDIKGLISSLNKISYKTANVSNYVPKETGSKKKKSSASYNSFSETVDWTTQKVEKLENEIDKLNTKLDNTTSLSHQIDIYKQLISKQTEYISTLKKIDSAQNKAYKSSLSKLSKSDKEKVENGAYNVETFSGKAKSGKKSGAEKEYNAIQKAIKLKDSLTDTDKKLYDAEYDLMDIASKYAEVRWDNIQNKIDNINTAINTLNTEYDNAKTLEEKNSILDEILAKDKQIYEYEKKTYDEDIASEKSYYDSIKKSNRKTTTGKTAEYGDYISAKGVTSKSQLAYIREYDAERTQTAKEKLEVNDAKATYTSQTIETPEKQYENNKAKYDNEVADIKDSQQDIENTIAETEAKGELATAQQYQDLMDYSEKEEEVYKNEEAFIEEKLKSGNLNEQETADYTADLQECKNNISECEQAQAEWNEKIKELPIEQLEKANTVLDYYINDYQSQLDDYNSAISGVTDALDEQISSLEEDETAQEDYYQNLIDSATEQLDALEKTNDAREKSLELQQAEYALEQARNQKSKRVYREGQGFVYEADTDAIREAQNNLDELNYQAKIDAKNDEIDSLNDTKDTISKNFSKQIDILNKWKDKWSKIADLYDKAKNEEMATKILGSDWLTQVLNGNTNLISTVTSGYQSVVRALLTYQNEKDANTDEENNINKANANEEYKNTKSPLDNIEKILSKLASNSSTNSNSSTTDKSKVTDVAVKINNAEAIKIATKQHDGMELGYAGTKESSDNDDFRYVSLDTLKPNEIMKVLKIDEAVLTRSQRGNIMSNISNAFKAGIQSSASLIGKSNIVQPQYNIGDIYLSGVNDVNGFADAIKAEFVPTLNQKLYT